MTEHGDPAVPAVANEPSGAAKQAITHLAFYAGWPRAMSAMAVARQVFSGNQDD